MQFYETAVIHIWDGVNCRWKKGGRNHLIWLAKEKPERTNMKSFC